MPVAPGVTESLTGGSGITTVAFVERVLRDRFEDTPYTERAVSALDGAGATDELTVKPGALKRFQVGGWLDFMKDGTFETLLIEEIKNDTTLVLRRAHRGSTIAAHAIDAEFRYMARIDPNTIVNEITESIDRFWPDIFEVRHVPWTVPTPVDLWWTLPADAERVLQLYQQRTGAIVDLASIGYSGIHEVDSIFISTKKALKARNGISTTSPDGKLHGIYVARCDIARLTTQQITLLTYEVAMASLTGEFTGESKPERRSGLEGAPDSGSAMRMWALHAEEIRKREALRLADYLPRKRNITYRGLRHYSDDSLFNAPGHPQRPF